MAIIDECNRKNKEAELVAGNKSTGRKPATEVPELTKADRNSDNSKRDTKKRKSSIREKLREYEEQANEALRRAERENEERKRRLQEQDR